MWIAKERLGAVDSSPKGLSAFSLPQKSQVDYTAV